MSKELKAASKKHAIAYYHNHQPTLAEIAVSSFEAGARWQAKRDADVATEESQSHSVGGFSQLGFRIAIRIESSVG